MKANKIKVFGVSMTALLCLNSIPVHRGDLTTEFFESSEGAESSLLMAGTV